MDQFEPMVAQSWNLHLGYAWAKLLDNHALDRTACLIEIGPGFADKIGLGLAELGFRGTLYVVEPNADARQWAVGRYREILADAEVLPVAEPVAFAAKALPRGVEALLMNHVLDDLVLHAALAPEDRHNVFAGIRPNGNGCHPAVQRTWRNLFIASDTLADLGRGALDELDRLVEAIDPRVFGVSQYSSWFLQENGLDSVDRLGAGLLSELVERHGRTSEDDRTTLARSELDPERWLFVERHSAAGRAQ